MRGLSSSRRAEGSMRRADASLLLHLAAFAMLLLWWPGVRQAMASEERLLARFPAPEARQGVAVDGEHVYVISNHSIGKYEKGSFRKVASWECPEGRPLTHLNAGIVMDGKLYCAHSNYPGVPMTSSLEVWDTETLAHVETRSFGPMIGSLTWLDRRDGSWYACFAHYANRAREPSRDPSWTTLVRFDENWQRQEAWVFPPELVERFGNYSSSGGAFGPDGRLYVTGHDNQELYVLEFPAGGSTLQWVSTIPIAAEGQAFAWDPSEPWTLYSIVKRERTVIVSRIEENGPQGSGE